MSRKIEKHIMQKYGLNRRQYLTLMATSVTAVMQADPIWKLFKGMVHGMINHGTAHANLADYPFNLFGFFLYGGKSAWDTYTA